MVLPLQAIEELGTRVVAAGTTVVAACRRPVCFRLTHRRYVAPVVFLHLLACSVAAPPTPAVSRVPCRDVAPAHAVAEVVEVEIAPGGEAPACAWTCAPGFLRRIDACQDLQGWQKLGIDGLSHVVATSEWVVAGVAETDHAPGSLHVFRMTPEGHGDPRIIEQRDLPDIGPEIEPAVGRTAERLAEVAGIDEATAAQTVRAARSTRPRNWFSTRVGLDRGRLAARAPGGVSVWEWDGVDWRAVAALAVAGALGDLQLAGDLLVVSTREALVTFHRDEETWVRADDLPSADLTALSEEHLLVRENGDGTLRAYAWNGSGWRREALARVGDGSSPMIGMAGGHLFIEAYRKNVPAVSVLAQGGGGWRVSSYLPYAPTVLDPGGHLASDGRHVAVWEKLADVPDLGHYVCVADLVSGGPLTPRLDLEATGLTVSSVALGGSRLYVSGLGRAWWKAIAEGP